MDAKKNYEGEHVFIKLKNGREYSGEVKEVNAVWLSLLDKFNKRVTISLDQVSVIEEQREIK